MIIRQIETCPKCGKWQPWRKYSTRVVKGERRVYVKCTNCGAREVVVYRAQPHAKFAKCAKFGRRRNFAALADFA